MKSKIIILFSILLFIRCTDSNINEPEIIGKDNLGSVMYKENTQFKIVLEGNITTGYGWEIALIDSLKLKQIGSGQYVQYTNKKGSPGNFVFKFETLSKGTAPIEFYYKRPGGAPIDSFKVNIKINE